MGASATERLNLFMKKLIAMLLLAAMLVSLTACRKKEKEEKETEPATEAVQFDDWEKFLTTATTEKAVVKPQVGGEITVAPVAYRDNVVCLDITLNNTTDRTLCLDVAAVAVNGITIGAVCNTFALPGEQVMETLSVSQTELRMAGIFQIATVEFLFDIQDEDGFSLEVVRHTLTSSAGADFQQDADASLRAFTSSQAQSEMGYTVVCNEKTRVELGDNVYLENKVFIDGALGEILRLEVRNEDDKLYNLAGAIDSINGLNVLAYSRVDTILPNTSAVVYVQMELVLSQMMREAFGVDSTAKFGMELKLYDCQENGAPLDSAEPLAQHRFEMTIPEREVLANLEGTLLYYANGLEILAKKAVYAPWSEDQEETYVYLVFRCHEDKELTVELEPEKPVVMNGGYSYFEFIAPETIAGNDYRVGCVRVDNIDSTFVELSLLVTDAGNQTEFTAEICVMF